MAALAALALLGAMESRAQMPLGDYWLLTNGVRMVRGTSGWVHDTLQGVGHRRPTSLQSVMHQS